MFLKLTAAGSAADDRKAAAADIVAAVNKDGATKVLKASRPRLTVHMGVANVLVIIWSGARRDCTLLALRSTRVIGWTVLTAGERSFGAAQGCLDGRQSACCQGGRVCGVRRPSSWGIPSG